MSPSELEIGKAYDLGGTHRYLKRVVSYDPDIWPERGGQVIAVSDRPNQTDGLREAYAGDYFVRRIVNAQAGRRPMFGVP